MHFISAPALGRRHFLQAGATCALAVLSRPVSSAGRPAASDGLTTLLWPGPARLRMTGDEIPATEVWTYNGVEPGPVLRLRQGTPLRAVVENGLAETTTVHWHGIRLPNAMDGVPGVTQTPIPPGGHFDYAFTPPDAGTFWYHSHDDSLVQMGRGHHRRLLVRRGRHAAARRENRSHNREFDCRTIKPGRPDMKTRHTLIAAALAVILGGLVVPALAEAPGGSQMMPNRDVGSGHTDQGRPGGMMGGCMGMMQSMNHGNGRPNSQWQQHPPADRSMN